MQKTTYHMTGKNKTLLMKRPEICILKRQMCFDDSQEHRSYDKENNRDSDDESSRICILKIDSISLW